MNEQDMAELMDRATRDLAPDVGALVAGGLARGLVRRRRRRTAMSVGAGLAVVLTTAGALQLSGELASRDGADLPAGPASATPTTPPTTAPTTAPTSPAAPGRARLAVTTDQVPITFASLEPGAVSPPEPKSGPDSAPVVDFTWKGYGIRIGLTPDDYTGGPRGASPAARCAESPAPDACRPGADGTVVTAWTAVNPPEDGGTSVRSAQVFRPDGWDVLATAYNGPGKEGPVLAPDPPLSLQELEQVASSDVWFR